MDRSQSALTIWTLQCFPDLLCKCAQALSGFMGIVSEPSFSSPDTNPNWIEVWILTRLLDNIYVVVLNCVCSFGCLLVGSLLKEKKRKCSPQSQYCAECIGFSSWIFSIFSCIHFTLYLYKPSRTGSSTEVSPQHDATTTMLHGGESSVLISSAHRTFFQRQTLAERCMHGSRNFICLQRSHITRSPVIGPSGYKN